MIKRRRLELPGNLGDKRLELGRFIGPGKGPAHVAGGIAHVGAHATRPPLLIIGQGLQNEWDDCKHREQSRMSEHVYRNITSP